MKVANALEWWNSTARAVESTMVDNIAATTPWLAPVIPACFVYQGMVQSLGVYTLVALAGAIAVECLGVAATQTTLWLWEYNITKRKLEPAAPVWLAASATAFYFIVVLTVAVMLHDGSVENKIARGMLSALSLVASIILAVRASHVHRLKIVAEIRKNQQWVMVERRQKKAESAALHKSSTGKSPADWRKLSGEDRARIAGMSTTDIMAAWPVSDRTARAWREKAGKNGKHE